MDKQIAECIDQLETLILVLRHLDPPPKLEVFGSINKTIKALKALE